jgi:hypothetical protein
MSERFRDIKLRWRNHDLIALYDELIRLRAEVARRLNPLKISPPRKCRNTRRNRLAGLGVQRTDRPAVRTPILLLVPGDLDPRLTKQTPTELS